jgi:hypothetical protein
VRVHVPPVRTAAPRLAPTLVAAIAAGAYLIAAPRSADLAAQLLRVKLFDAAGFTLWDNWWYAGHAVPGYSILFPPLAHLIGPRLLAALAATLSAAAFGAIARAHDDANRLAATWFGAATVTPLLSGRLTFAAGLLPALLAVLALQRRRPAAAAAAAAATALTSPVAALLPALAGGGVALAPGRERGRRADGILTAAGALLPIAILAVLFPEGGTEPFAFSSLWPVLVISVALVVTRPPPPLMAGLVLYALVLLAAYALPNPLGGNAVRLGQLAAGPVALLVLRPRRTAALAAAVPLLYLQLQPAIRDVAQAQRDPSTTAAYYRPLLGFLHRVPGPTPRIEIPFTAEHWEAYEVPPAAILARGWERQLDRRDNPLFYTGRLTAARYDAWLHELAVRFVALPDAPLDASARGEAGLVRGGQAFLVPVFRSAHWRVYAVRHPAPIATGARLTSIGPASVTLRAPAPGRVMLRVRFSPYWRTSAGCVSPGGAFTMLMLRRATTVRLTQAFALNRIGARSPRCAR